VTSPTRRFALPWEDSFLSLLMYIDSRGNVSADFLEGSISNFGVTGSQVAVNGDDDRFVVNVDNRILVIRRDGGVFAHAVRQIPPTPIATGPLRIMPPVACSGSKVAFNGDDDRFVTRMFNRRIIVVRRDGTVFGHDVIPDGDGAIVQPPFAFAGSKVAFNGEEDGQRLHRWAAELYCRGTPRRRSLWSYCSRSHNLATFRGQVKTSKLIDSRTRSSSSTSSM
jgi:hypothetical protein